MGQAQRSYVRTDIVTQPPQSTGHRENKLRLGPPEPRQPNIAPCQTTVNRPDSQPSTRSFRPKTQPQDTPLPAATRQPQSQPPSRALITPRTNHPHHPAEPAPPPTPAHRTATPWPAAPARSNSDPGSQPAADAPHRSLDT